MNILIICDGFPPDTVIGGIRPFMFAKYLSSFGHQVTIINSGKIHRKLDNKYLQQIDGLEIFSAYPLLSETQPGVENQKKSHYSIISPKVYKLLSEIKNILKNLKPFNDLYHKQRDIIDSLSDRDYDIVFTTFSPIASIYAGQYAVKKFNCRWILDFRDALVQPYGFSWLWNFVFRNAQKHFVEECDICTVVSNGVGRMVSVGTKHANVVTLYNGYDSSELVNKPQKCRPLTLCYTGAIYCNRMEAMKKILSAISKLKNDGYLNLNNICIKYAGPMSTDLRLEMCRYGLETILDDYGYISVAECDDLQRESDLFIVLSWNTKEEQGIMTGKFYEGIRAEKQMLVSVVGNAPNSELAEINKKYNYGFCYEETSSDPSFDKLCDFLREKYDEKMKTGELKYDQNPLLTEKFNYENLARELEGLCLNVIRQ